ncbi:MAG TPA: nucleotidyltransferase family protein [Casimicrobiaceae bacterium]|nr:nucleotidyltransferase family protein [Casimicrobiaceae bacterium]
MRIVGILLAAGGSVRFGSDKLIEPLLQAAGDCAAGTPIGVAACRHLGAAVSATVAVVRPSDTVLATMLRDAGARVVECARAEEGMGVSLACGVQAAPDAGAWLIALADMPWIRLSTINLLASALAAGADIVAPSYHGERGHPVGFARRHYGALAATTGDEGARAVLLANRATLHLVSTDDPGVVRDVDTRDQL